MATGKEESLKRRHCRIRKRLFGSTEKPRLCVHRSHLHLNVQLVNDYEGKTLFSLSTLHAEFRKRVKNGGNISAAKEFGKLLAEQMKQKDIRKVVFDRGGFLYHGRVKALADSLRENGIQF